MKLFEYIVFVDDDFSTNYFNQHILQESKICKKFKFFLSAEEALSFFKEQRKLGTLQIPEYIFSDINMPKIDGWEFLQLLDEELPELNSSKIVLLSTSSNPQDISRVDQSPNIQFLHPKPLTVELLKRLV